LTGFWQVNGKNRTTFNEMIHLIFAKNHSAFTHNSWLDPKKVRQMPAA
jgi:hypothetical protein